MRNEDLDGDELIRLTSEARRLLQLLRRPALPVPEPMSIEEHLAAYGAVEPRQAREPSGVATQGWVGANLDARALIDASGLKPRNFEADHDL